MKTHKFKQTIITLLCLLVCLAVAKMHNNNIFSVNAITERTFEELHLLENSSVYKNNFICDSNNFNYSLTEDHGEGNITYNLAGEEFNATKFYTLEYITLSCATSNSTKDSIVLNNIDFSHENLTVRFAIKRWNDLESNGGTVEKTYYYSYNIVKNSQSFDIFLKSYINESLDEVAMRDVKAVNTKAIIPSLISNDQIKLKFEIVDSDFIANDSYSVLVTKNNLQNAITTSINDKTFEISGTLNNYVEITVLKTRNTNIITSQNFFFYSNDIMPQDQNINLGYSDSYIEQVMLSNKIDILLSNSSNIDLSHFKRVFNLVPNDAVIDSPLSSPIALFQNGDDNNCSLSIEKIEDIMNVTSLPDDIYKIQYSILDIYDNILFTKHIELPINKNSTDYEFLIQYIDNIGTIAYDDISLNKIIFAERYYLSLPQSDKLFVTNYNLLLEKRAYYDNLKVANDCEELINEIGTISLSENCLVKILKAEISYSNLTNIQKSMITNYSTLQSARLTYDLFKTQEEQQYLDDIDSITLNYEGEINLFLGSNPVNQTFCIEALGVFKQHSSLALKYAFSINDIVIYEINGNSIFISPKNEGKTTLLVYYELNNGRIISESLVINVNSALPNANIEITKNSYGPYTIYDTLELAANIDYDFVFSNSAICEWAIDGETQSEQTFKIKKTLSAGEHTITAKIFDSANLSTFVYVEREIYVYDSHQADHLLSLNYTQNIVVYSNGNNIELKAFFNNIEDSTLDYQWSISDLSIIRFVSNPNGANNAMISFHNAGNSTVFVSISSYGKIYLAKLDITVFDEITNLEILVDSNVFTAPQEKNYRAKVNGYTEIANITYNWIFKFNGQTERFSTNVPILKYSHNENTAYDVKLTVDETSNNLTMSVYTEPETDEDDEDNKQFPLLLLIPIVIVIGTSIALVVLYIKKRKNCINEDKEKLLKIEQKKQKRIEEKRLSKQAMLCKKQLRHEQKQEQAKEKQIRYEQKQTMKKEKKEKLQQKRELAKQNNNDIKSIKKTVKESPTTNLEEKNKKHSENNDVNTIKQPKEKAEKKSQPKNKKKKKH